MNVDKNSVLSNKKDTGKNERSGSWSSNPDFNEAMDGWMDTAYQYRKNEERHEEVIGRVDELNDLCASHFKAMEILIKALTDKVDKLQKKVELVEEALNENTDDEDETNSNGSRVY